MAQAIYIGASQGNVVNASLLESFKTRLDKALSSTLCHRDQALREVDIMICEKPVKVLKHHSRGITEQNSPPDIDSRSQVEMEKALTINVLRRLVSNKPVGFFFAGIFSCIFCHTLHLLLCGPF